MNMNSEGDSSNSLEDVPSLCPATTYQCPNRTVSMLTLQLVASYVTAASSLLSCVGALLIIVAYIAFKDIRKGAQTIITQIAVADFIYSTMFLISALNYFAHYRETDRTECVVYENICTLQAYFTVWSAWSVFVWNSVLAFYFCVYYIFNRKGLAIRLMPVYNVTAWGLPIAVVLPLLCLGKLGKRPDDAVIAPVCFVRLQDDVKELLAVLAFAQWIPEFTSYIFVVVLYTAISVHLCRKRQQGHLTSSAVQSAEKRLLLIPLFYILTRVWDTVEFIIVLADVPNPCTDSNTRSTIYNVINILEVAGGGGQGFVNSILFIFASKEMRQRLFWNPFKRIATRCRRIKPTRSRARHALPDPQLDDGGGVTSDNSPLVVRTADVAQETDHGYDTYFSLPSEFPPSVAAASGSSSPSSDAHQYQPRVRLSLPAVFKMRALSSSGELNDTYFSPPVTGLASND